MIATDKGYNVYVCGNGGSKPKHAELLVADVSEELAIKYLDRFLMYYIMTADKLTRTARWLEKLDGGINYLRKIVIEDHLGIVDQLEQQMAKLIDAYQCEWTTVVRDPKRRKHFDAFVNSDERDTVIEMIDERGQRRPADWPKELPPMTKLPRNDEEGQVSVVNDKNSWLQVGSTDLFPMDEGKVVRVGNVQIAVFHTRNKWYATQNMCPHKRALVLASGLLGNGPTNTPYVSCPMHKKNFDLATGDCMVPGEEEQYKLETFDVKVDDDQVYLSIPSIEALNETLGSGRTIIQRGMSKPAIVSMQDAPSCGTVGNGCGDKTLEW